MVPYEPERLSTVLYEEGDYKLVAVSSSHVVIKRPTYHRASAGFQIEEIPVELEKKLISKGLSPKDYFYVRYILVRSKAREAFDFYVASLRENQRVSYVRSVLPRRT